MNRIALAHGAWIDLVSRRLVRGTLEVGLSHNEARLLAYLAARPKAVVRWDELEDQVWHHARGVTSRAPYFAWRRLVHKVEPDPAAPANLHTVHGDGICYVPQDDVLEPTPHARSILTSFVGRSAELDAVRAAFARGARWVTLGGPGGAGKTRLALELGMGADPPQVWCDLGPCRDAAGVTTAVAHALRAASQDDVVVALRTSARTLVLDAAEGAGDPVRALVGRWLVAAPQVRVLVTSRRELSGVGEHVVRVGPMARDDASALFAERAIAADPQFVLDDVRAEVDALITAVDALPLGIELAAARVKLGALQTHRVPGLDVTVAWSWSLLPVWERRALEELSVFRGGATEAAVAAVVDTPSGITALDVLESLVKHNLLTVDLANAEPRYVPYAVVAQFAAERLGERPDVDAVRHRHAAWFARLGRDGYDRDPSLEPELENLRAAAAHAPDEATSLVIGLRTIALLGDRGPLDEALGLCGALAARAERVGWFHALRGKILGRSGLYGEAREAYRAALALAVADPKLEANAWSGMAVSALLTYDTEAGAYLEQALALWRRLGSAHREVDTLCMVAALAIRNGAWEDARTACRSALVRAREARNREGEVQVRGQLARIQLLTGDPAGAEASLRELLASGPPPGDYSVQHNLAAALLLQRRLDDAQAELVPAIARAREQQRAGSLLLHLQLSALIALEAGRDDEALALSRESSALEGQIGRSDAVSIALRGVLAARSGRTDEARTALEQLSALPSGNVVGPETTVTMLLAELQLRLGDVEGARVSMARMEELARFHGVHPSLYPGWDRLLSL